MLLGRVALHGEMAGKRRDAYCQQGIAAIIPLTPNQATENDSSRTEPTLQQSNALRSRGARKFWATNFGDIGIGVAVPLGHYGH